jgi:lauroyl/myristoyl acyltransferase
VEILSNSLVKRLKRLALRHPELSLRLAAQLGTRFGPGSQWAPQAEEITALFGERRPRAITAIQRRMAADLLRSLSIGAVVNRRGVAAIADRVQLVHPERILSLREQGERVVIVTAHVGGGRGVSAALERLHVPARVATLRPAPAVMGSVRFESPGDELRGASFLRRAATDLGQGIVPVVTFDGALNGTIVTSFLGRRIRLSRGLPFLAARGARMLPVTSNWVGRTGTIEVTFHPAFPTRREHVSDGAWLESIVGWFEDYVRRNPSELRLWKFRELLEAERLDPASPLPSADIRPRPTSAQECSARADRLLEEGRIDEAIRSYRQAIRLEPKSAWHHQGLAVALGRKGWDTVSRPLYWRALELDPAEVRRWHETHPIAVNPKSAIPYPVFILGCPHSGTTILARLLGNHPSLMNAERGETRLFSRPAGEIESVLQRWDRGCLEAGKRRWVEKSVAHTFVIPWLVAARPRARFLISMRDGRDVFCSLKKRRGAYRDVNALIDQWIYANLAALQHRDDPRFLLVKYEDLVSDPEATLTRACRHVGEDYAPELLEYWRKPMDWNGIAPPEAIVEPTDRRSSDALRTWQINQPLFDGRGRWKSEMNAEDKERFKRKAQHYLAEWGYAEDDRW